MNALVSIETTTRDHTTTSRRPIVNVGELGDAIVKQDGRQRALKTNSRKRSYRLGLVRIFLSLVAPCCYLSFVQFSCMGVSPRRALFEGGFSKWRRLSTWGDDEPASGAFTY